MTDTALSFFQECTEVIPGGVNSPVRSCTAMGLDPVFAERGEGAEVVDRQGRRYLDYCMSWGALLHGHAHPLLVQEAVRRVSCGSTFGMPTEVELDIANKIVSCIPSVEKIRFVSSGTEAAMSAVRLARGFTGRDLVIKFNGNYHGHADPFLVQAGSGMAALSRASSAGVPKDAVSHTLSLPYNDVDLLVQALGSKQAACVILEPVAANMGVVPPTPAFLQTLVEETQKSGTLLLFDEVITGFRLGIGGAQALYGVTPDLTILGKVIGGGFPAAAFGGREDVMRFLAPTGPVYQAGTLSGNPVAMAAGLAAIELAERDGFYRELEEKARIICDPVANAMKGKGVLQRVGSLFTLFFGKDKVANFGEANECDQEKFALLYRHMRAHGILLPPSPFEAWFISASHTQKQLERSRDLLLDFLKY